MSVLGNAWRRWQESHLGRSWARYSHARGNVLAGGIAYFALFSIFPALALGFTAFGIVLGGHEDLQRRLVEQLNETFGTPVLGLRPGDQGIVTVDQLTATTTLSVTGLLGAGALVLSGLGWIEATRVSVRAMFGRMPAGSVVGTRVRDLATLAALGLCILTSVVATITLTTLAGRGLGWLGLPGTAGEVLVTVLVDAVLLAIDVGVFLLLLRVLSGVDVPVGDLLGGAVLGGVGVGLLKVFGGLLLRSASGNEFLAAFATVIGLLVWMNAVARLTLVAACFAATTAADRGHLNAVIDIGDVSFEGLDVAPAGARTAVPAGAVSEGGRTPMLGQRSQDRVAIAAGAVLGAFGLVGLRAVGRAGRAVVKLGRGRD